MGGSFGGMMMRHANRLSGWGSNDPVNTDAKPRKKHPDVIAATKELHRIQDAYQEAKINAFKTFHANASKHFGEWEAAGLIRGDESIGELLKLSREL